MKEDATTRLLRDLSFRVAQGEDRLAAIDLQGKVYLEDIGHIPNDGGDERADHLIAQNQAGETIAAMRVVGPASRPFDLEQFVSLADFIPTDRFPALVGRFCVRHDYRRVTGSRAIHLGMFNLAYAFARKHHLTDYVLYTYDNLLAFYRGALFREVRTFAHPLWGEVHLMHLDILKLQMQEPSTLHPLARRLLSTELTNVVV